MGPFKGVYSLVALVGFALIVWAFSRYRAEGLIQVWNSPTWTHHLAMTLMWFAFVALACINPAPGKIKGWLRHPMLVAVKKRGDIGAPRIASFTRADALALGAGTLAYAAMIFLHPLLIGVAVIGG